MCRKKVRFDGSGILCVLAHCGSALPALSRWFLALGGKEWESNLVGVVIDEMKEQLRML
jgi:hypothetical protein